MLLPKYQRKLLLRVLLLLVVLAAYIIDRKNLDFQGFNPLNPAASPFLTALWVVLIANMLVNFFNQEKISMGSRKHFAGPFMPDLSNLNDPENAAAMRKMNNSALLVLVLWAGFNLIFFALYKLGVIGRSELLLLCLFYFVCDLICVIYYCPFQSIFMKNRCCVTCRIFNWDHMMMYTPMLFVPGVFSWSLAGLALMLMLRWEYAIILFPERFLESTNRSLRCAHCTDKMCGIKKPLRVTERG
ncbi:MAG: hypothetical protein Q4B48_07715 [Syntrophomonadaceae bacterium]|nr:hypothetical protein [Syntrophomonadaceae bacterium]